MAFTKENVVKFNSSAKDPYYKFSNFHNSPFNLKEEHLSTTFKTIFPEISKWITAQDGVTFPSSEHAWHSLKSGNLETFLKFCDDGEFTTLQSEFFSKFLKKMSLDDAEKKVKYWGRKKQFGIVARLAVSDPERDEIVGVKGGINRASRETLFKTNEDEATVWKDILRQKYLQNKDLLDALLKTDGKYLLEFSVSAKRNAIKEKNPIVERYAGFIDEDGKLYGENRMGVLLAELRDELADE